MTIQSQFANSNYLELTLPLPPSVNHYWKHRVIKNRPMIYLSAEGVAYKRAVLAIIKQLNAPPLLVGRLRVVMTVSGATRRKYDIDNRVKSTLDALTHAGVWLDDEQVDELHVIRGDIIKGGKLIIKISEITGITE